MAAKASIRIENNSDKKKREFTLVKIITYNFLHKIGFIFFCNYEKPLLFIALFIFSNHELIFVHDYL